MVHTKELWIACIPSFTRQQQAALYTVERFAKGQGELLSELLLRQPCAGAPPGGSVTPIVGGRREDSERFGGACDSTVLETEAEESPPVQPQPRFLKGGLRRNIPSQHVATVPESQLRPAEGGQRLLFVYSP